MKYKLTGNIFNVGTAPTELGESQLELLTDGLTSSSGISLAVGDEIRIVCDLFNRYDLDSCKYYFSGGGDVTIEAAESYNVWSTLSISSESGYVEALFAEYAPRWIRITHDVTATVDVYELEVYSNGNNILFGYEGQFDSYGIDSSGMTVHAVQLYNNTGATRDISVFIEDDLSTEYDSSLLIGLTSSGVFYDKYERSICFPDNFSWDAGVHLGTITTVTGHLTISGALTSGTYYSPVLDMSSHDKCRIFWERDYHEDSVVDYNGSIDSEQCFGVRRHHIAPSGVWTSGTMADESDSFWSLSIGTLSFEAHPNNTILELRDRNYIQFSVTLSGSTNPHIYKAGVESPLTVSGVYPGYFGEVYVKMGSSVQSGQQLGLLCWYKE